MPVSSPSYFPPSRTSDRIVGITAGSGQTGNRVFLAGQAAGQHTTQSDLICIGDNTLSAGTAVAPLNDANAAFSTIIGSQSGAALKNFTTSAQTGTTAGPVVIIGGNNLNAIAAIGSTVAIGANIAPTLTFSSSAQTGGNVFIGVDACGSVTNISVNINENVVIGYKAYQGSAGTNPQDFWQNVIIGSYAGQAGGINVAANVIIGANAAVNISTSSQRNVSIGEGSGSGITSNTSNCTFVGDNADGAGGNNTCVGANAKAGTSTNCVLLGDNITGGGTNISGAIAVGSGATIPNATQHIFVLETNYGAVKRTLFYSDLNAANVIIGNSTAGTNRDFAGTSATNIVKLLNGTVGNANPVGGGYFYVTGGALHWVGSSGTDTQIAPA